MTLFFAILLTGILTDNFVLSRFLGICPFLGVSKKLNTAVGMSAAVMFRNAAGHGRDLSDPKISARSSIDLELSANQWSLSWSSPLWSNWWRSYCEKYMPAALSVRWASICR